MMMSWRCGFTSNMRNSHPSSTIFMEGLAMINPYVVSRVN
ncbi:hypothetical protein LINGRAHAP2_LOCUS23343 [Linum grandiflorum]